MRRCILFCLLPLTLFAQPRGPRIQALNDELQSLSTQSGDSARSRISDAARARFALLGDLVQADPAEALRVALPAGVLDALHRSAAGAPLESRGEWSGTVDVTVEDDFEHASSLTHTTLTVEGRRVEVHFARPLSGLRSGATIRAGGIRVGDHIASVEPHVLLAGSGCATVGQQKLAVLLVNFPGSTLPSNANSANLNTALFGSGHSLDGYWREASYGVTSATGNVFGPFALSSNYTDYTQLRDAAIAAAAGSVTFANYNHVVIIMPSGFPSSGGLGTLGCSTISYSGGSFQAGVVWIRSDFFAPNNIFSNDMAVSAAAHENGHNLGLQHASSEAFASVPLGSLGTVPTHTEYGDNFSAMGLSFTFNGSTLLGHYAAQHKIALGWMSSNQYQNVTSNGTFTVKPYESSTTGLQALRIRRGSENNLWLWLEYRQATGYDAIFGSSGYTTQVYGGGLIHLEDPANSTYTGYTRLLNFTAPAHTDFSQPALVPGSTWSDPYSLLTITATSATATGLNVTVSYDTPCVTLAPLSKNYSSSTAVASDSIAVTGACAWTAISNSSWISLTGSTSGSTSGPVTYSLTANTGPMPRTGSITIGRQTVYITQASSNPQPIPVSIAPASGSSAIGTRQSFTANFTDADGNSDFTSIGVLFNTSTGLANACHVEFEKTGEIRLYDDGGLGYSYTFPGFNTLSNSQCTLDGTVTTVIPGVNTMTMNFGVTFLAPFAGAKNVYLQATDVAGADSGFVPLGTWSAGPPPLLSISKTHTGSFQAGQQNATYTITVSNAAAAAATLGTVTVNDTLPSGLALVSMAGAGWSCSANTCTRSDSLAAAASFPSITVTVNVAGNATTPQVNSASVSGGASVSANTTDSTVIAACSFSLTPTPPVPTVPFGTGTGSFNVVGSGCTAANTWTAVSDSSWLVITGNASGSASGTVTYSVAAYAGTVSRTGNISVAGLIFPVTQLPLPVLTVTKSHSGSFFQGQTSAQYTVTVGNTSGTSATSGTVTVTENIPAGLTLSSMAGTGWSCATNTCTRSDALPGGLSYPAIAVTVNVAANAGASVTNQVTVGGGSSLSASASDVTTVTAAGQAPPAVIVFSPAQGAGGVSLSTPLTWGAVTGATSYDVYFGTSVSPPFVGNTTGTTFTVTMNPSTLYYWIVTAKNSFGSTPSALWFFTTAAGQPPPAVTVFTPGQGVTAVATNTPLTWGAVAGATSYDVLFGTTTTPPLVGNTTSTSFNVAMNPNTTYYWIVTAKNAFGSTPSLLWVFTTGAATTTGLRFVPVTPCRILDTRLANGSFGGPIIPAVGTRTVPIPSSPCGIPATVQAYSLNITVVPPGGLTYLTIWPTGQPQPNVSTLNSLDGRIVANAAIVPAGTSGSVNVFTSEASHVIIDINGYFAPASTPNSMSFYSATPCRVMDTRGATGLFGGPFLTAGTIRVVNIPASACGVPATAQAYSVNMTVVPRGPLAYLTTWPTGQPQPVVSTLNAYDGSIVANAAIVPAGTGGSINVYVTDNTDLIIDINGYFAPPGANNALSLYTLTPCRIADTRFGSVPFGGPILPGGTARSFPIPSSGCSVPGTAQAYSLNVTVVPPGPLTYLTAWPTGFTQPVVSTLNSLAGKVVANAAIVPAGTAGAASIFVSEASHVILDINAYFAQ